MSNMAKPEPANFAHPDDYSRAVEEWHYDCILIEMAESEGMILRDAPKPEPLCKDSRHDRGWRK